VKMSFVTAAMLWAERRARQRASIRAVLPEPTGLVGDGGLVGIYGKSAVFLWEQLNAIADG